MHKFTSAVDSGQLLQCVRSRDELTLVVRGHLCLEAALNLLLAHAVPEGLDHLEYLGFAGKVDLAIAMGQVPMQLREAWLGVNKIRNRFAHNLDATLDEASVAAMYPIGPPGDALVGIRGAPRRPGASLRSQLAFVIAMLWTHAIHQFMARGEEWLAEDEAINSQPG
jgi:hypothetical protein